MNELKRDVIKISLEVVLETYATWTKRLSKINSDYLHKTKHLIL